MASSTDGSDGESLGAGLYQTIIYKSYRVPCESAGRIWVDGTGPRRRRDLDVAERGRA